MYVYKLVPPASVPSTVWACKTTVNNYNWKNTNKKDMMELSLCKASRRRVFIDGIGNISVSGTCFSCSVGDEKRTSDADEGVNVEILSVALRFDGLSAELCNIDGNEGEAPNRDVLLIPVIEPDLSEQEICEIEALLYRYVHCYMESSASSEVMRASIVFELFSRLDGYSRKKIEALRESGGVLKKDKYINYYVAKAESIIKRRYSERLTLMQTANELNITASYLSSIFRASTGVCFSDRLLQVRMERAKAFLCDADLSVKQIAEAVGFEDESHFRKRFKRYFGVSIREYNCINKEQTLYHKKPTK